MLPAEMADGTRAQVQRRREEAEAAEEGDANPAPNPEVVLPNNQDGDNPLVIPDREEDETRDDYAVRVMQAVSQHQIHSFNQMIQSMRDISKEVKKKQKPEWEETDEDEDTDNSNYQDAVERPKIRRIRKRIQAPIFKGMIGERPEPHLLRAVDWFDSQGIRRDIDKVYNFKHTLDGEAREWYADYARQTDVIPPWKTFINDFSRYYSSQGRGEKNLHEAWRNMSFTPATDDVEVFLRDLQECAKQLKYDDQVVITTIRAAMPQEIYGALYKMTDLSEVIDFCKNYYAKSPKERLKAQSTAKLDVSPFKKIQDESPPDITKTLSKLTESLNKMDFTQKPYKPTLYPSGRGRGRGRGGRFQGRRFQGNQQSSYQPCRGRGRGGFRGKPRGGKFDKSPTKRVPRENSKTKDVDKDRCRYCREIGHWVKDCPQKKKDQEKGDTEDTFTGLSEITQDFYGARATDMFHGITDIYVESEEEDNILEPEVEDKPQDREEYLN